MKMNVSMNDELASRVDEYAKNNYMSRSGLVSVALSNYLNQHESYKALSILAVAIQRIADNNAVSDEDLKALEDFKRLAELILTNKK